MDYNNMIEAMSITHETSVALYGKIKCG